MNFRYLQNAEVDYIDDILFDNSGLFHILPEEEYRKINFEHLLVWAVKNAVYTFPTKELVEWFGERIAGKTAIEICAGHGGIGRALNIVRTDSCIQRDPTMASYYLRLGQAITDPPIDVKEYEANDAVDHFKPQVVIGAFVTQKYLPGDERPPKIGSSIYGVDELSLFKKVETYIFVGNDKVHGDKRIMRLPHETFRASWLITRAMEQEFNFIKVFNGIPRL